MRDAFCTHSTFGICGACTYQADRLASLYGRSPSACPTCRYNDGPLPTDPAPLKVAGYGFLCPACGSSIGWRPQPTTA